MTIDYGALGLEIPTPFYIYDLEKMRISYQAFEQALRNELSVPFQICYAVKSNSNLSVLKNFQSVGSGFDIVSGGELARCKAIEADPKKIVFAGVGKTHQEIRAALDYGIKQFNVESVEEFKKIHEIAVEMDRVAPIAFRINPDVDAGTHEKITTGKSDNKFGVPFAQVIEICQNYRDYSHCSIQAVSVHIGSQITNLDPFKLAFSKLRSMVHEIQKTGVVLKTLDLGGGLGVVYDREKTPCLTEYAQIVEQNFGDMGLDLEFEPGRLLTANAGYLVSSVTYVKKTPSKQFLILDAAMNDLVRPSMYDAYHDIIAAKGGDTVQNYDIVGPVCESGDTFAKNRQMPQMDSGDIVIIKSSGAYGACMSNMYNTRDLIAEYAIDGDKTWQIRKPVTPDMQMEWEAIL